MVVKNVQIEISVKANRVDTDGYRSIIFDRPKDFNYESGDWIDIQYLDPQLSGGRTYSLSSSPTEPDLMITFKEGFSELKKRLASAKAGDKFTIVQYGNDYGFTIKPHKPSVLIAGGVGIAPFRSMIKELYDLGNKDQVELLYLNKTPDFLFMNELNQWQATIPNFSITYLTTENLNKKKKSKAILNAIKSNESSFYIAGPEAMAEFTEHLLLDNGVDISNIKIDSFGGY